MGEAKQRKLAGCRPGERMFTIGIVATRWDDAPKVRVATALLTIRVQDIKDAVAKLGTRFSKGDLVSAMREAFDRNQQVTHQDFFGSLVMAYVGQTRAFETALRQRDDALWLKLMARGDNAKARPFMVGNADLIIDQMEKVRRGDLTDIERMMLVYSDHLEDQHITGPIIFRQDKSPVTLGGMALSVTPSWGTGKTENVATNLWEEIKGTLN